MKNQRFAQSRAVVGSVLTAVILSGCLSQKSEVIVKPAVVWMIAGSKPLTPDKFKEEALRWFSPFLNETVCDTVQVFPQVEVVWRDGTKDFREEIIKTDPVELTDATQNTVQKLFGAQPAFDDIVAQAGAKMAAFQLPDVLIKSGLQSRGSESLVDVIVAKRAYQLIAYRSEDMADSETKLLRLKNIAPKNSAALVIVGNSPEKFKAEIIKSICARMSSKQEYDPILLIDPITRETASAVPPVEPIPAPIPASAPLAVSMPASHPTPTIRKKEMSPSPSGESGKVVAVPPIKPDPSPRPSLQKAGPAEPTDCMPGTLNCDPMAPETLKKKPQAK